MAGELEELRRGGGAELELRRTHAEQLTSIQIDISNRFSRSKKMIYCS
jgi:hypothetical protein